MKVSVNTIKRYLDFELPATAELAERINAQLGAIEEIIDLSAKYKRMELRRMVYISKLATSKIIRLVSLPTSLLPPPIIPASPTGPSLSAITISSVDS